MTGSEGRRRAPSMPRCTECRHTGTVHTPYAHNGAGGCAYCRCPMVLNPGRDR